MKKVSFKILFITALLGAFSIVSCKKSTIDYTFIPERQFTPVQVSSEEGETEVILSWSRSLNAQEGTTYTVEVSKNQDFTGGAEKSFAASTSQLVIRDTEIDVKVDYYARVKANAINSTTESNWLYSSKFKIIGEQYLYDIKYDDIYTDKVIVKWDASKEVTHLLINGNREDLLPTDIAAGEKEVTGLTPGTPYIVFIYNNTVEKGSKSFSTKGAPVGTLIYLNAGDDIKQRIESEAVNGSIFVLPQGTEFTASDVIIIPGNISITIYGAEGPNRPVIKSSVSRIFLLPENAGTIKFQNVDFTGNLSTAYFINQAENAIVDKLEFENCILRDFVNNPIRFQNSGTNNGQKTIKNLVVNYCIVANHAAAQNYAFFHTNIANGVAENIYIGNSTFYNIGLGLVLHTGIGSTSLLVENCTIYDVSRDGRYLIDYNTMSVGSAEIRNTIIAKSKVSTARGIRMASPYVILNSYQTADYQVSNNAITGISNYAKSSTDLFTDPLNADFSIKDADFEGKSTAGDPRWR